MRAIWVVGRVNGIGNIRDVFHPEVFPNKQCVQRWMDSNGHGWNPYLKPVRLVPAKQGRKRGK